MSELLSQVTLDDLRGAMIQVVLFVTLPLCGLIVLSGLMNGKVGHIIFGVATGLIGVSVALMSPQMAQQIAAALSFTPEQAAADREAFREAGALLRGWLLTALIWSPAVAAGTAWTYWSYRRTSRGKRLSPVRVHLSLHKD